MTVTQAAVTQQKNFLIGSVVSLQAVIAVLSEVETVLFPSQYDLRSTVVHPLLLLQMAIRNIIQAIEEYLKPRNKLKFTNTLG